MNEDATIDELFDRMDGFFQAGRFDLCDAELRLQEVGTMTTTLMVAYLVVTLPAKDKLTARVGFFSRVEACLRERERERVGALLTGLR